MITKRHRTRGALASLGLVLTLALALVGSGGASQKNQFAGFVNVGISTTLSGSIAALGQGASRASSSRSTT